MSLSQKLRSLSVSQRLDAAPSYLREIVEYATALIAVERVILFGSRARGDERETSDVDLAFEFPASKRSQWSQFKLKASDEARTLLSFDLVDLSDVDSGFRSKILSEGIVLFEKKGGANV